MVNSRADFHGQARWRIAVADTPGAPWKKLVFSYLKAEASEPIALQPYELTRFVDIISQLINQLKMAVKVFDGHKMLD